MTLRVGVVGLGFMGVTHLTAYGKVDGAEVTAVVSSDEDKLSGDLSSVGGNLPGSAEMVDLSAMAGYRRFEDLLSDPSVDAVDLCVPTHLHASLAIQALQAGKHVLVEKPMALNGRQCQKMIEAGRRSGKVLMVAHLLRFWPAYSEARAQIRSGELGNPIFASFRRKCGVPAWSNWLQDPAKSGGGAFDLLIHDFDYCGWVFGKPESVAAEGVQDVSRGVDLIEARLYFDGGRKVFISGGWYPGSYDFSAGFSIALEEGTLDYETGIEGLRVFPRAGERSEIRSDSGDAFERELIVFTEACRRGEAPPECLPESSALSVEITLAALESRVSGGRTIPV